MIGKWKTPPGHTTGYINKCVVTSATCFLCISCTKEYGTVPSIFWLLFLEALYYVWSAHVQSSQPGFTLPGQGELGLSSMSLVLHNDVTGVGAFACCWEQEDSCKQSISKNKSRISWTLRKQLLSSVSFLAMSAQAHVWNNLFLKSFWSEPTTRFVITKMYGKYTHSDHWLFCPARKEN